MDLGYSTTFPDKRTFWWPTPSRHVAQKDTKGWALSQLWCWGSGSFRLREDSFLPEEEKSPSQILGILKSCGRMWPSMCWFQKGKQKDNLRNYVSIHGPWELWTHLLSCSTVGSRVLTKKTTTTAEAQNGHLWFPRRLERTGQVQLDGRSCNQLDVLKSVTLWFFNIAMEHGLDDLWWCIFLLKKCILS